MVVDALPVPPPLPALVDRHVAQVPLGRAVVCDDPPSSLQVILLPWRQRNIAEEQRWWRGRWPMVMMRERAGARLTVVLGLLEPQWHFRDTAMKVAVVC
jgi:hypothetical protein